MPIIEIKKKNGKTISIRKWAGIMTNPNLPYFRLNIIFFVGKHIFD